MKAQVIELVQWLNTYDNNLIKRLRADKFTYKLIGWDTYEIKNNLGKIWVKNGSFLITFNNGWSLISTFNQNHDWVQIIKEQLESSKIAILLSTLPYNRVTDYPSLLKNLWHSLCRKDSVGWEELTPQEVLNEVLPYLQKTKSEFREGKMNSNYPWENQLKEIEQELYKVKSVPELAQLMALLET